MPAGRKAETAVMDELYTIIFKDQPEKGEKIPARKNPAGGEIINSKQIKKGDKYNIISKNHPLSVEGIKKKYGISDGGNRYLVFTQTQKGKVMLRST
jgi:hypothetical protein